MMEIVCSVCDMKSINNINKICGKEDDNYITYITFIIDEDIKNGDILKLKYTIDWNTKGQFVSWYKDNDFEHPLRIYEITKI
ncbi:MAG: hypothetical protein ACYCPT_13565 [Acidimicrobiales bacterium]